MDHKHLQHRLERAEQRVSQGFALIARQRANIAQRRRDGHDTCAAEEILQALLTSQVQLERHRETVARELAKSG